MIYYPVMGALFVILIVLIIIIAGISEFFLRFALSTSFDNTKKLDENTGYEISDEQRKEEEESRKFLSLCSDVYIKSKDGLKLHAYLARTDSHKYLITVHGYKGGATNNGTLYRYMAKEGYNILVLDVRGHGKSEGRWLSMGLWESDDLMRWIEYINALDKDAEIALHGVSMGAATVMMASGRNPDNVKAIIEDCGYSGTYEEFACQLKAMFHLPSHPVLDLISLWCRIRLGFFFSSVRPSEEVGKTDIPMLFIHGDKDAFVPFRMLDACFERHNGEKEKWITEGVEHAMSMSKYREEYRKKSLDFIERHMGR